MKALASLSLALACCAAGPSAVIKEDQSVRRIELDTDHDGLADGHCTAWSYQPGIWVTAAHCVDFGAYMHYLSPLYPLGQYNDIYMGATKCSQGLVVAGKDIGVFACPVRAPAFPIADSWSFGEYVHTIGYPDKHHVVVDGRLGDTSARGTLGEELLSVSNSAWAGGISGAPVINERGEVVGVAVSHDGVVGFAVSVVGQTGGR